MEENPYQSPEASDPPKWDIPKWVGTILVCVGFAGVVGTFASVRHIGATLGQLGMIFFVAISLMGVSILLTCEWKRWI